MIEKISLDDLRVGMYVVNTGLSWLDHPFLYSKEGRIDSDSEIERIRNEGYLEIIIDTERSVHTEGAHAGVQHGGTVEEQLSRRMDDFALSAKAPDRPPNKVSLRREMSVAKKLYADTLSYAREFMQGAKAGKRIDLEKSGALVEGIIESVSRNMDALVSLSKLRMLDEYTYTHCINVSVLAVSFGRFLNLDQDSLRSLGMAGLFHDLGKARSPIKVLNKPGRLTPEEFAEMQRHPVDGLLLLQQHGGVDDRVLRGVAEHHEKYSGGGYPRQLAGEEISPFARIVAVADVYDALTSKRVYKKGMPGGKAMGIIYSMRNTDFFPNYVEHFIKCIGVFPVGAPVRLSTGYLAVVADTNPTDMLRPKVSLAVSPTGRMQAPQPLDLSAPEGEGVRIETVLDPADYKLDPASYL